jgi:outer membrane protein assembly factor BamB
MIKASFASASPGESETNRGFVTFVMQRAIGSISLRALYVAAISCSVSQLVASEMDGHRFPLPGEWPCFRGNSRLDGHAEGTGQIQQPAVLWKFRFSNDSVYGRVVPDGTSTETNSNDVTIGQSTGRRLGLTSGPQGNIAGKIQSLDHNSTTTFADILPEVPGLEQVTFPSSFALPTKDGQWQYGPGQLLAWRDGQWHIEWQIDDVGRTFSPCPLVGDFDADGELEIAALPWYDLRVYDARTGQIEQQCEFTSGRSYGFFGAYDFDGDGLSEFLVLADFSKHFEVMGYQNDKLELLWQDEIELDISNPHTIVHVLPEPVADLDGDGRCEVVVAVFDKANDRRWHTYVLDGKSGRVRADIVDERIQGVADLDGDGRHEMLLAASNGPHIPDLGTIRVRHLESGSTTTVVWEMSGASWQDHEETVALHRHSDPAYGIRTVLTRRVDSRDIAVVRHANADSTEQVFSIAKWNAGKMELGPTVSAECVQVAGLDKSGNMIVEAECVPDGQPTIDVQGGTFEQLGRRTQQQRALTPPIVIRHGDSECANVVVQDTATNLAWVSIKPPTTSTPPHQLRRIAPDRGGTFAGEARGQAGDHGAPIHRTDNDHSIRLCEMHYSQQGPVAADLEGDGRRQLLVASATNMGHAHLTAVDTEFGRANWSRQFDRFTAGHYGWDPGGPLIWQTANLTGRRQQDVVITLRRSRMHSEETYAISGRTGETIWHRDRQIADRSFGGQFFAVEDFDADGLDDLASFYTHIRYIVDGATGKDLLAEENYWPGIPPAPVYWGQPVAGRFGPSHDELSLLFTTTGRQMIGLVRLDGSLAWSDAYDVAPNGFPAVGDFDGDQQLEVMFFGFDDGVRCYRAATGERLWTHSMTADQFSDAVSGDLDGDQRDEAVVVSGNTVYCVGTDPATHQGKIEWQLALPTTLSSPILADLQSTLSDSGEQLSVLVCGLDGAVYCIGQEEIASN